MSTDPFGSPDIQTDPTTLNASQALIDDILNHNGSLATLQSPSLIIQSFLPLVLSVIFLLGGRRLYRFSTSASLALSCAFFSWAIIVNVEPPQGLGASNSNPEVRALCVWSIMVATGLFGALIGFQSSWWGSSGTGLLALGANAGLSFSFSLLLLGDNLLIHSSPAIWILVTLIVILAILAVVRTEYVASLVACSLVGGFLFLVGVDLLINLGHEGLGRGICFLVDHNPDHREALDHYIPPKSTRVLIIISWLLTLCSIIFQSIFYQSLPFVPLEEYDLNPFRKEGLKDSVQDLEGGFPPIFNDEKGVSDKECLTITPTTDPRGHDKSFAQSSSSSLNPSLVSNQLPYHHPHPSNSRVNCLLVEDFNPDPNSFSTPGDPSRPELHSLSQNPSQSNLVADAIRTSSVENFPQSSVNSSQISHEPRSSSTSTSHSLGLSASSRLPLSPPGQVGKSPALSLAPTVYSRYRRTFDLGHEPSLSEKPPSRIPSAYIPGHPRRRSIRSRPAYTYIPRDIPSSIAQSQQLRRVDTVEEVTEASTSIRDMDGLPSARSSLITPTDLVRAPSVSEEYLQAILRLGSDYEPANRLSNSSNPSITANNTPQDSQDQILSSFAEGLEKEDKEIKPVEVPGTEIQPVVPFPTLNENVSKVDRTTWLGTWVESSNSFEEPDSKMFELSMPQKAHLNVLSARVEPIPTTQEDGGSDREENGNQAVSKDDKSSGYDERPSSAATQRAGFDFKRIFKKSSSSSLGRGLRLLAGGDREKSKTEDELLEDQPSSPASSCQQTLPAVVRRLDRTSSHPSQDALLAGNQRQGRFELSTSTSSDLLCRTARRLGSVRELAARSDRPRGTSILSISNEDLRLGGSGDEEARGYYLQRFSQRPLPRLPLSRSIEDHISASGSGSGLERDQNSLRRYDSIESSSRSDPGLIEKTSPPLIAGKLLSEIKEEIKVSTSPQTAYEILGQSMETDIEDEAMQSPVVPLTPMADRVLGSKSLRNPDLNGRSGHPRRHSDTGPKDDQDSEDDEDDRMTVRTPRSERSTLYGHSALASSPGRTDDRGETTDEELGNRDPRSIIFYPRHRVNPDELEEDQESLSVGSWEEANEGNRFGQGSPSLQSIPLPSSPGAHRSYDLPEQMNDEDFDRRPADSFGGAYPRLTQRMVPSLASFGGRADEISRRTTMMSSEGEEVWNTTRATSGTSESGWESMRPESNGFHTRPSSSIDDSQHINEPNLALSIDRISSRGDSDSSIQNPNNKLEPHSDLTQQHHQYKERQTGNPSIKPIKNTFYAEDEEEDETLEAVDLRATRYRQVRPTKNFNDDLESNNKTSTSEGGYVTAEDEAKSLNQSGSSIM
ncbi:hypothetical protein CROQUDRAFT_102860 [Cronartium quercuum f. sp. fusiforme G11]|uniref:TM7S3/TM198-like domain-containing protein n=1 Tax=Cronartium quercuum f. sp. fusiforme G11 TaxID=708437 RepID=A0A9P6NS02_9BASI|nr:hypothetical protein CROQUDRAFT_102860 [Cronartium quercuum f. sp. fusiforme G11]